MSKNFIEYIKLKIDKNYIDVAYNKENGGLKATHVRHNFDPNRGKYEKEVQEIGFKNGNSIILESEKGDTIGQKYADGLWNGKAFDVGTSLGIGQNNIKSILNHARSKNAEIAIIYFPDKNLYSYERLNKGISKYNGQTKYKFYKIIYIVDGNLYEYK